MCVQLNLLITVGKRVYLSLNHVVFSANLFKGIHTNRSYIWMSFVRNCYRTCSPSGFVVPRSMHLTLVPTHLFDSSEINVNIPLVIQEIILRSILQVTKNSNEFFDCLHSIKIATVIFKLFIICIATEQHKAVNTSE